MRPEHEFQLPFWFGRMKWDLVLKSFISSCRVKWDFKSPVLQKGWNETKSSFYTLTRLINQFVLTFKNCLDIFMLYFNYSNRQLLLSTFTTNLFEQNECIWMFMKDVNNVNKKISFIVIQKLSSLVKLFVNS